MHKNSGQVTEWYYLTDPLIRIFESSSSALWWDAVITARVSSVSIKRLCCWYKMFQSFGWKSNPEGQMTLRIMYVDPNHGILIQSCSFYLLCPDRVAEDKWASCTNDRLSDVRPHASCHMRAPLPCYRHRMKPGWRRFTVNQWEDQKEDTSALGAGGRWLHWSGGNL